MTHDDYRDLLSPGAIVLSLPDAERAGVEHHAAGPWAVVSDTPSVDTSETERELWEAGASYDKLVCLDGGFGLVQCRPPNVFFVLCDRDATPRLTPQQVEACVKRTTTHEELAAALSYAAGNTVPPLSP